MSRMANTVYVSRRLLQTISQIPSTRSTSRHFPCYHPPPKEWIRTITSSSARYTLDTPGVSFGEENDGVIAPYIEKSNKKAKSRKKKTTELAEPVVNEDYEIGGFIDRSASKKSKSFVPLEELIQAIDDEAVAGRGRRKTGKSRRGDNSLDGQQDAIKKVLTTPKTKMLARKVAPHMAVIRTHVGPRARTVEVDSTPVRKQGGDGIRTNLDTPIARRVGISTPRKVTTAPSFRKSAIAPLRKYEWEARGNHKKIESSTSGRPLEKRKTEGTELWATQKNALKEKFQDGWKPRKKLSPDAMEGIRGLHEQDPLKYTTELLASEFQMSPEAIRRILKSKWLSRQSPEKLQERRERWAQRHDRIWDAQAELGLRPPRTKDKEVEDPDKFEQDLERRRILGETLFG